MVNKYVTWTKLARDSEACLTAFGARNELTPQGDWRLICLR